MSLRRRIVGGPFKERDSRTEEGNLFFLFFELTALFFYFFVGDALAVVRLANAVGDRLDLRSW